MKSYYAFPFLYSLSSLKGRPISNLHFTPQHPPHCVKPVGCKHRLKNLVNLRTWDVFSNNCAWLCLTFLYSWVSLHSHLGKKPTTYFSIFWPLLYLHIHNAQAAVLISLVFPWTWIYLTYIQKHIPNISLKFILANNNSVLKFNPYGLPWLKQIR